jgi:hypothetical protein
MERVREKGDQSVNGRQRTELGVTTRHHVGDLGEILIADLTAQHTLLRSTGHAVLL